MDYAHERRIGQLRDCLSGDLAALRRHRAHRYAVEYYVRSQSGPARSRNLGVGTFYDASSNMVPAAFADILENPGFFQAAAGAEEGGEPGGDSPSAANASDALIAVFDQIRQELARAHHIVDRGESQSVGEGHLRLMALYFSFGNWFGTKPMWVQDMTQVLNCIAGESLEQENGLPGRFARSLGVPLRQYLRQGGGGH